MTKFIKLTTPDGEAHLLNVDLIECVKPYRPNYRGGIKAGYVQVCTGKRSVIVKMFVDELYDLLRGIDGVV